MKPQPRADYDIDSRLPPTAPAYVAANGDRKVVLYDSRGVPLVRPIGYRPATRKDGTL